MQKISDTAAPTATPNVLGNAAADQLREHAADERLGKITGQQAGYRDAQLGARQHERGAPRQGKRPLGRRITRLGARGQPGAVDRRVRELLRNEIGGKSGDQNNNRNTEADVDQGCQHAPTSGRSS